MDAAQSHHARDVLRLAVGERVEAFDDAGAVAEAEIIATDPVVVVRVQRVSQRENVMRLTIASAVPKGERADWMIEKLSELGCARFIPLAAARSVVLPEGHNKRQRWMRLATESAKQSRRAGVMQIEGLMRVAEAVTVAANAFYLSTASDAEPIVNIAPATEMTLLVGPEGGWTTEEMELLKQTNVRPLKLTQTVLRVETAAVASAAVVMCLAASNRAASNRAGAT